MILDTSIAIAGASGLIGALLSAYLSYVVRLKVRARQARDFSRRVAHVHFLQLTDFVGSDIYCKQFLANVQTQFGSSSTDFSLSHQAAAFLANKIASIDSEALTQIHTVIKPLSEVVIESINTFSLSTSELVDLPPDTSYFYGRYMTASMRLKGTLKLIVALLEKGDPKVIDASMLHGSFQSYRAFADSSGILRASFRETANVTEDYSLRCLIRSYTAIQKQMQDSFQNSAMLGKAKQAAMATADAVDAVKQEQAGMS